MQTFSDIISSSSLNVSTVILQKFQSWSQSELLIVYELLFYLKTSFLTSLHSISTLLIVFDDFQVDISDSLDLTCEF